MDSEDDDFMLEEDEEDSENESEEEQAVESDFDIDCEEPSTPKRLHVNDDFHYECLTPEALVTYMNGIIDEVNSVFQVSFLLSLTSCENAYSLNFQFARTLLDLKCGYLVSLEFYSSLVLPVHFM